MENQQIAYDMFKKLAYKKFKNIPLYLEWAPINVLDKNVTNVMENSNKEPKAKKFKKLEYAIDEPINEVNEQTNNNQSNSKQTEDNNEQMDEMYKEICDEDNQIKPEEEDNNKQKSFKILIKNIPFEASVKDVRELFSAFGELQFVRLPKKLQGTGSHRGFAFVEYVNKNDAKKAFNSLSQSTHLYGRRLVLEWAKIDPNSDEL